MGLGVKIKHYAKEEKLQEDATISQVASEEEKKEAAKTTKEFVQGVDDVDVVADSGDIETALNDALETALESERYGWDVSDRTNVLLVSVAGVGKSSRVRAWASRHNINLFEVRAAGMDETDLGGAVTPSADYSTVVRLASTEFDFLNKPRSVLFLDEINRAPKGVRTNLLELINSHVVPDPRSKTGQRKLDNFLFTVAAVNPFSGDYDTDKLDDAEMGRFAPEYVEGDPAILLNHLTKVLTSALSSVQPGDPSEKKLRGRLELAKAILGNKNFVFDSERQIAKDQETDGYNRKLLEPREFTKALFACNGTKADLLNKWSKHANNLRKPMIDQILSSYKDVEDKATQALAAGTDSEVFKKKESAYDKLQKTLGNWGN